MSILSVPVLACVSRFTDCVLACVALTDPTPATAVGHQGTTSTRVRQEAVRERKESPAERRLQDEHRQRLRAELRHHHRQRTHGAAEQKVVEGTTAAAGRMRVGPPSLTVRRAACGCFIDGVYRASFTPGQSWGALM